MRRLQVLSILACALAAAGGDAGAQDIGSQTNALPAPPVPREGAPIPDLRYRRTKTADENSRSRLIILERLRDQQRQLKDLDRQVAARATQRPGVNAPAETLAPASVTDRDDARGGLIETMSALRRALEVFETESRCGSTDESQDVEFYDGKLPPTRAFVDARQPATAQIQWKPNLGALLGAGSDAGNVGDQRWCSGTLISDRIFLTAGHCFDVHYKNGSGWRTPRRPVGGTLVSLSPQEFAPLMQLNFNYQIDAATRQVRTPDVYPIAKVIEYRLGGLDYAVLEVGPGPDGKLPNVRYPAGIIDPSAAGLAQVTQLTVIQHPDGVPKRVAAGTQRRLANNNIYYSDIDTLGGSSGAGVINQAGRVVGVHTNGGCTATGGENLGVTVQAISRFSQIVR